MNMENKQWWKGTFPSWIVVALVGLLVWMSVRLINEHDAVVSRTIDNRDRIILLEQIAIFNKEQIGEMKSTSRNIEQANRGILEELVLLRRELRNKP